MESITSGKDELILEKSASKIQQFWRGYIDKQVFRYYCKLIDFKSQGDPSVMLKCINPKEIELFDSAFGALVKFRLGGETFPPNIYYKIFTHRPIQDLCANSPKNYNQIRKKDPRIIHNKHIISPFSTQDWYKRIENNGWRQVSDKNLTKIFSDPITYESSIKPVNFEFNQTRKRESKNVQRKKIKLKWLRKMYNLNMLDIKDCPEHSGNEEESGVNNTRMLVQKAAESMIEIFEKTGEGNIEDWAVDELLGWTNSLKYDEYLNDWNTLATSLVSDWKLGTRNISNKKEAHSSQSNNFYNYSSE